MQSTSDSPGHPTQPAVSAPEKEQGRLVLAIVAIIVLGCVAAVVALVVIGNRPKPAPPARPVQVSITTARQGDMGIYVEALGAVTPVATVAVPSQVAGQLTNVNFAEGQMVSRGGCAGGN